MKYDFDKVIDRRGTDSIKWAVKDNELPMWVADMDFPAAPAIVAALKERVEHGVYGYTAPGQGWYDACIRFHKNRHGWKFNQDSILFSTGVVPSISSAVRAFTDEGDAVIVFTPVYNIFFNSIVNNHRRIEAVPLLRQGDDFFIDFEAFRKAAQESKAKLLIFCNPANPIGRIWTKEELAKVAAVAKEFDMIILSDEIHGEITRPGKMYHPFLAAVPEAVKFCFSCISPTKAFNLAGIQTSAIIAPDPKIRAKIERQINTDEVAEPNVFACVAAATAWGQCEDWLDECREYLFANRDLVERVINSEIPGLHCLPGDATYLLWIEIRDITEDDAAFADFLRSETGLFVSKGSVYGEGGKGFLRLNVACPRESVLDGIARLKDGVKRYLTQKGRK